MRILICSIEAPLPPTNGLRLQVKALAAALRERHEVKIVAFRMPDQHGAATDQSMRLVDWPQRTPTAKAKLVAQSLLTNKPFGLSEIEARMRGPLVEEMKAFRPDVVHVTPGRLAGLANAIDRPAVLAALDAAYVNYESHRDVARGPARWVLGTHVKRMRRFEGRAYTGFSRVVVVTEGDRTSLHSLNPSLPVDVVPNGVDDVAFGPVSGVERDPNQVIFSGVMSYSPNIAAARWMATEVMPRVRSWNAEARFSIVGRAPSSEVVALADTESTDVVGEVADMAEWLSRAGVYVCPMVSGTGIKNKLLEGLVNGAPCVATTLALQGLSARPGREVLGADDPDEFAEHVARLTQDRELAARLGEAGRAYAVANHSWGAVASSYEAVYDDAIATFRSSTPHA
jgi:polysaccharide biosynthesis protein PslH